MDNEEVTITQALNQIQSWLNAGNFEMVIQGCKEILSLEPSNQRALALMKKAMEATAAPTMPAESVPAAPLEVAPPEPEPEPVVTPTPIITPVEKIPSKDPLIASLSPTPQTDSPSPRVDALKKEKLVHLLAMIIPAILVVAIGSGVIWNLSNKQNAEIIKDAAEQNKPQGPKEYLAQNEERVKVLTQIAQVLEAFKEENGRYPAVSQIDEALKNALGSIPTDPKQGRNDKSGKFYGYVYAVYNSNTEYIISAIFEDSKGFAYPWSKGANISEHPEYRDLSFENVYLISGDGKGTEPEEIQTKVKVKRT